MKIHSSVRGYGLNSVLVAALLCSSPSAVWAVTVNLDQAVDMALNADPRIKEREAVVERARGLLDEVYGRAGLRIDANAYVSAVPGVEGGIFQNGASTCTTCTLRDDGGKFNDGISVLAGLQFALVQPLYTFGKVENYSKAAKENIQVREGDVRLTRAQTQLDVRRAYYGYLTARDTRVFLVDLMSKVDSVIAGIEKRKSSGKTVSEGNFYALQAVRGLVGRYLAQAKAIEAVSMDGLKTLVGVPLSGSLEVSDAHIEPVALPEGSVDELVKTALVQREEMAQVEAGMTALRAMVKARRAEMYPNVYAAVVGGAAVAPGRDTLDNPYIFDNFNHVYAAPVLGLAWNVQPGLVNAQTRQAEADLREVTEKANFARIGIPFQVAEAYHRSKGGAEAVQQLKEGFIAGRRWFTTVFMDSEASTGDVSLLVEAFRTYTTMYGDYLLGINDYNMQVAQLRHALGEWK
ncbi:MAG: TolC family protein [Halothiobacillaceae bacterium]